MKKAKEIKMVCEKCGWENQPTEKSNKNWKIINIKCDKCGGKLKMVFKHDEKDR